MNLLEKLTNKTLLADGAMGTMLHARGIGFDKCFDELNLTTPPPSRTFTVNTSKQVRS